MNKHQEGWQNFIELCLSTKDPKTLAALLEIFLTPEEKEDITARYLIIKELLQKEKTQRQIAKDLNISIAKITRGSNELKRLSDKLFEYLRRFIKSQ
jgi:TrpR family trp operon transcriptional repressor